MANQESSSRWRRRDPAFDHHSLEPPIDVERFVMQGHAKVIGHYRRLLSQAGLTPAERADIEARLAHELQSLPLQGGYLSAA